MNNNEKRCGGIKIIDGRTKKIVPGRWFPLDENNSLLKCPHCGASPHQQCSFNMENETCGVEVESYVHLERELRARVLDEKLNNSY